MSLVARLLLSSILIYMLNTMLVTILVGICSQLLLHIL